MLTVRWDTLPPLPSNPLRGLLAPVCPCPRLFNHPNVACFSEKCGLKVWPCTTAGELLPSGVEWWRRRHRFRRHVGRV